MKRTPIILLMIIVALLVLTYIVSYRNNTLHMKSTENCKERIVLQQL